MFIGETQFVASNRIQYAMYYDGWLNKNPPGGGPPEKLTAASATIVNYSLATIDTIVIEPPNYDFFTFYLTGGSAGDIFQINLQVTTSLGQIRNDYMTVVVGPNGNNYSYSASLLGPTGPTGASGTAGATGATGTVGSGFWPVGAVSAPPTVASGAWTNHNFAASTSAADFNEGGLAGIRLKTAQPSNSSNNHRSLIKAAPSTPYNLIGRFRRQQPIAIGNGSSVHHCLGLVLYESSSSKALVYGLGNNSSSNVSLVRFSMTNDNTFGTNFEMWGSAGVSDAPWEWFIKIYNDGTNLQFYFSYDGWYYNYMDKLAITTPFTTAPNYVGWGMVDGWWTVNSDNNAAPEIVLDCGGWSCG